MRGVESIVSEVQMWKDAKSIHFEPLNGGCVNCTYKVRVDGVYYVLRINGDQNTYLGLKREGEVEAVHKASKIGIAPNVFSESNSEYLITEYVQGGVISKEEIHNPLLIRRAAETLLKVHGLEGLDRECSPFDLVGKYLEGARALNVKFPEGLTEVLRNMDSIENRYSINYKYNKKYCHNDYYAFNIINNKIDLFVIDWELSGYGDAFFDMASLSFSNSFSEAEDEILLKGYFGNVEDEYKLILYDMKYMNMLREISWALLHSGLDVKKVNHDVNYYNSAVWFFDRLRNGYVSV